MQRLSIKGYNQRTLSARDKEGTHLGKGGGRGNYSYKRENYAFLPVLSLSKGFDDALKQGKKNPPPVLRKRLLFCPPPGSKKETIKKC